METLEDEVQELVQADRACQADLQTCENKLKEYENPRVTCGTGTVKKDWYCRSMGLNDVDFEVRGTGVGAGLLMLMMLTTKR